MFVIFFTQKDAMDRPTLSYLHIHFNIFDFFHIYYTLTHSLLYVSHAHRSSQHTDIKYDVHILSQVIIIYSKNMLRSKSTQYTVA